MSVANALISVEELASKFASGSAGTLRVLDCTVNIYMKPLREEYLSTHIPQAQFFDLQQCSEENSPFTFTVPTSKKFEEYVGGLGISNNDHVVVYDNAPEYGMISAARVWWMFRLFGHDNVSVLDGGLSQWVAKQHPCTNEIQTFPKQTFTATFREHLLWKFNDVIKNVEQQDHQIVDAIRYPTSEGEIEGLSPGHIPNALYIPFFELLNVGKDGTMKSVEELKEIFKKKGVHLDKPVVASCFTGLTACWLAFAAHLCSKDIPVYDGSWHEYFIKAPADKKIILTKHESNL